MRHCTKCGKEVQDSWKFCLGCGAEVPAEPGPAARTDGIAAPPVMRPPETPGASATTPGGVEVARVELEIPRYRGGQASAGKPGAKPAVLFVALGLVALAGVLGYFLLSRGGGGESGAQGSSPPVEAVPGPATAANVAASPAEPQGVVDRTLAEAERQLGQARSDLERELREDWNDLNTEPDPGAGLPKEPDRAVILARFRDVQETIYACASGRTVSIDTKVTFEGATGRVTEATVEGDLSTEAKECIVEVLRGMSVPPFSEASVNVNFPIRIGTP
jgi:hypothetical protein